ncbi:MAG TPA: hypothetical protein DDZ11_05115 [Lentisphaeria bacterium]|nr:hypothetical protein [Lentisphaeria bacterium]
MMNLNRELRDQFAATWNVFFSLKLQSEDGEPRAELFPLAGAAVGLISALAAGFARLFFGELAAALLMALALTLALELATNWRGLKTLSAYLTLRVQNTGMAEAFTQKLEWKKEMTPFFILASLYLIRATAIGFITAHSPLTLLFIFTCAYLVRMELVTCAADDFDPLLPAPEENPNQPFILTAATLLLIGLLSFHLKCFAAAVVLLLLAKGIAHLQKNSILHSTGRPTIRMFDLYGYSAETLLLLAGMIMA